MNKKNKSQMVEQIGIGHPDRFCDYVAESILDYYKNNQDKIYNYAIEVMVKNTNINIIIETTNPNVYQIKIKSIYRQCFSNVYSKNVKNDPNINTIEYFLEAKYNIQIDKQSQEITNLVENGEKKAGDNGVIFGYAGEDFNKAVKINTKIHKSLQKIGYIDYKYLVDCANKNLESISINCIKGTFKQKLIWNNVIEYQPGGIFSDTGLTGRKLMCDTYFGIASHGGGNIWGKDPSKVDKSAKFYARWLAKNIKNKFKIDNIMIKLVYIIGNKYPKFEVYSAPKKFQEKITKFINNNNLTVQQVINKFKLNTIKLSKILYNDGNIFYDQNLPWEKIENE